MRTADTTAELNGSPSARTLVESRRLRILRRWTEVGIVPAPLE